MRDMLNDIAISVEYRAGEFNIMHQIAVFCVQTHGKDTALCSCGLKYNDKLQLCYFFIRFEHRILEDGLPCYECLSNDAYWQIQDPNFMGG